MKLWVSDNLVSFLDHSGIYIYIYIIYKIINIYIYYIYKIINIYIYIYILSLPSANEWAHNNYKENVLT